jgi:hypothetical protein
VAYSSTPIEAEEIPLLKGERIMAITHLNEHIWHGTNSSGAVGFFPSDCVLLDEAFINANLTTVKAVCIHEFKGLFGYELSLNVGDEVQHAIIGEYWCRGYLKGRIGDFPIDFVQIKK